MGRELRGWRFPVESWLVCDGTHGWASQLAAISILLLGFGGPFLGPVAAFCFRHWRPQWVREDYILTWRRQHVFVCQHEMIALLPGFTNDPEMHLQYGIVMVPREILFGSFMLILFVRSGSTPPLWRFGSTCAQSPRYCNGEGEHLSMSVIGGVWDGCFLGAQATPPWVIMDHFGDFGMSTGKPTTLGHVLKVKGISRCRNGQYRQKWSTTRFKDVQSTLYTGPVGQTWVPENIVKHGMISDLESWQVWLELWQVPSVIQSPMRPATRIGVLASLGLPGYLHLGCSVEGSEGKLKIHASW